MRPVWAIVALVVAAAVQLVVTLAPDAYSIVGPYFLVDANMVLRALRAIAPFGLAAAVLVGASRWDAGQAHLVRAAGALAIAGAARLAGDLLLATWSGSGDLTSGAARLGLPALFLAGSAATALATFLLAAGLWAAARSPGAETDARGRGRVAAAAIGGLGAACTAATAWAATEAFDAPPEFLVFVLLGVILVAIGVAGLAALGIAAVRAARFAPAPLPEILIAAGATLAMLGVTIEWVLPFALGGTWPPSFDAAFLSGRVAAAAGFVAVAAGFVVGGLGSRPATRVPAS